MMAVFARLPQFCFGCCFAMTVLCVNLFAAAPLQINKVSANPKTIDVSKNETAKLQFEITKDAFVDIYFSDEDGVLLFQHSLGWLSKGMQTYQWNGKNHEERSLKRDVVIYAIEAKTKDSEKVRFDPKETGGHELSASNFTFGREKGSISYSLPQAARVRLRAGMTSGALYKTIFDWQAEEAGKHEFVWDGKDESGIMNLLAHPELNLNLNAFSLPDNSILIKGSDAFEYEPSSSESSPASEAAHFHAKHKRSVCHEPNFKIHLLDIKRIQDGLPVLQGKSRVTISLSPYDKTYLTQKRFEVMFYLDTQFLFEEEQAMSPATFYVDLTNVKPGDHLLAVNVMSYDDHIGVNTAKVRVENSEGSV